MKSRGIIDPVSHISHNIASLSHRNNDPFFLVGLYFGKDIDGTNTSEQSRIAHLTKFRTAYYFIIGQPHLFTDAGRNKMIVTSDDLKRHSKSLQLCNSVDDICFWRIKECEKTQEYHLLLITFVYRSIRRHVFIGYT